MKVAGRAQGFLLYDLELALAKLLDGRRSMKEVLEQANRLGIPATPQSLQRFLRQLWQYGFLDAQEPTPAARTLSSPETFSGRAVVMRLWSEEKQEEALSYLEMLLGRFPEDESLMQLQALLREKHEADLREGAAAPGPTGRTASSDAKTPPAGLPQAPSEPEPVFVPVEVAAAPPEALDQDRSDADLRAAVEGAPEAVALRGRRARVRRLVSLVVLALVLVGVPLIPLPLTITEPCLLVPSQEAVLRAGGVSRIVRVEVKEGQAVAKGDLLLVLDSTEARKDVDVLEAERTKALAALELGKRGARKEEVDRAREVVTARRRELGAARRSYSTKRSLFAQQMVARDELDNAQAEMVSRQGALADAESQLKLLLAGPSPQEVTRLEADLKAIDARLLVAREVLAGCEVKSPIAGRVATARIELKRDTMTASGAPMVEIVNTERMGVELYVPQAKVDQLKLGLPVTVKVPNLPDERFDGQVEFVSPVAERRGEPPEHFIRVDLSVDNPRGLLKPQMTGYGEIRLGTSTVGRQVWDGVRRWLKYRFVL